MSIVRVEKNTYTADPLYQWDVDQTLEIYGLSLPSIPEIHYTNAAMERAVVRHATMDAAGVIRAEIPNALLQKPYKIAAYVCIYEGGAFRSLYKIEINVKERPQPSDYVIVDDPDIYDFNALEAKIDNVLRDYSEIEAKYAEAVDLLGQTNEKLEQAEQAYAAAAQQVEDTAKAAAEKVVVDEVAKVTPDTLGVYTKEQTLTAETREQYGLGENAVPDDVLKQVGERLDESETTVEGLTTDVAALQSLRATMTGAARITFGSYTGTGSSNASTPTKVTVDFEPLAIFVGSTGWDTVFMQAFKGNTDAVPMMIKPPTGQYADTMYASLNQAQSGPAANVALVWGDNSVAWYGAGQIVNKSGKVYTYVVIGRPNEEATA